jgi:hypothetical protein
MAKSGMGRLTGKGDEERRVEKGGRKKKAEGRVGKEARRVKRGRNEGSKVGGRGR